jgi:hypothetical protein
MVEVKKQRGAVVVLVRNGLNPWDVYEYFVEDLWADGCDAFELHGVRFAATSTGLVISSDEHFLFYRPTRDLRIVWDGDILVSRDLHGNLGCELLCKEFAA